MARIIQTEPARIYGIIIDMELTTEERHSLLVLLNYIEGLQ